MPQQNLFSPHSGIMSTITPGNTMSRSMGQYGKGHGDPILSAPTAATNPLKDGGGGIKTNPREGGLGAGPQGNYGSVSNAGAMDAG